MRVYRDQAKVIIETVITDDADKFTAELDVASGKINILNTSTRLYEVWEMLWSDIKDINNASLADATATKNYLDSLFKTKGLEIDDQGRQIIRSAAGKKGWVYLSHPIEIETSKIGGAYSTDYTGTLRTDFELKLYDANNVEITDQTTADLSCVKTVVTFKPSYDFEILSGSIYQATTPASDVRLWVIGGVFAVATNTPVSVKEFVTGFNMKFIGDGDHIETDGRASKYMAKDMSAYGLPLPTYQGNCFQYIVRHDTGIKHKLMVIMEYFRV